MLLSRWKLMAGVLGVSIGGLAAAASQCPKWDKSKGRAPEDPVAQIDTKVAPAGPAPELPAIPGPSSGPAIPAPPQLTPAGATPAPTPPTVAPALPDFAPTAPKPVLAPPAGVMPPADKPNLPETAPSYPPPPKELMPIVHAPTGEHVPMKPAVTPPAPASDPIPPGVPGPAKPMSATPPAFDLPVPNPVPTQSPRPVGGPPAVIGAGAMQPAQPAGVTPPVPAGAPGVAPGMAPAQIDLPAETPIGKPAAPAPAAPTPAAQESKFRILLRVGEGEPTFEVKNGDNLVLKVACEKVDIKSPEKGAGLSEVTARGKVRFAGFGAEGTCDELKFFAGNGEVSMSGEVKVIVRDKLGRVESELTGAGPLKYKIDASSVGGQIRP